MVSKRHLLPLVVGVLVLTAGCAGLSGDAGSGGDGGPDGGGAGSGGGDAAPEQSGGDSAAVGQPLRVDRAIVRTGSIALRVGEFDAARSEIAGHARSLDGYVSGSSSTRHTRHNASWTTGRVVIRVPGERFGDALSFARERGTVLNEETGTEDVTDRLVDLEARLANSEERRERLRSFYRQANSTRELLRIEETLSAVQAEIERLQAEKRSLEDRVAYATLRVELREPAPSGDEATVADASLVSAFVESATTMVDVAYGVLLFGVRLSPYLVFPGLPAVALWVVVRRRSRLRVPWSSSEGVDEPAATTPGEEGEASGPDSTTEDGDR